MEPSPRFTCLEGGARLAAAACSRNTIATEYASFISTRLLYEDAYKIRGPLSSGYKRSVYVTRSSRVAVVAHELCLLTDLRVAACHTAAHHEWAAQAEDKQVVVCTSTVLAQLLTEKLLDMSNVNVIVIDSCHLIHTDSYLKCIMEHYKLCDEDKRPRVLALTYPLFQSTKKDIDNPTSESNCENTIKTNEESTLFEEKLSKTVEIEEISTKTTDEYDSGTENYENEDIDSTNQTVDKTVSQIDNKSTTGNTGSSKNDIDSKNDTEPRSEIKNENPTKLELDKDDTFAIDKTESDEEDIDRKNDAEKFESENKSKDSTKLEPKADVEMGGCKNLDDFELYEKLEWKIEQLEEAVCCQMDLAEDIDGGKRLSATVTKPRELIIQHSPPPPLEQAPDLYSELDRYMRETVSDALDFICDHRYDPTEIYGEDMYDEFKDIPDPTVEPKRMIQQFIAALDELGPYAADVAAFSLLSKLEKLKIKVPYERHFLLLCLCTSVFVKIRSYSDYIFTKFENDWDRIRVLSTPKVMRLAEVLVKFQPPEGEKVENDSEKNLGDNSTKNADKDCIQKNIDNDSLSDKNAENNGGKIDKSHLQEKKDQNLDIDRIKTVSSDQLEAIHVSEQASKDLGLIENNLFSNIGKIQDSNEKDKNEADSVDTSAKLISTVSDHDKNTQIFEAESAKEIEIVEKASERTIREKSSEMIETIDNCVFITLSNKIEDRINTYEANLKDLDDLEQEEAQNAQDCVKDAQKEDKNAQSDKENAQNQDDKMSTNEEVFPQSDFKNSEVLKGMFGIRRPNRPRGRGRGQRHNPRMLQLQQNPDALCGIVFLRDTLLAKIMFHVVADMSRANPSLSYLCAQYCGIDNDTTDAKENQRQGNKQEGVLKKFRMHECNILLATPALEEGIDLPRCNLVLRWDLPTSYRSYGLCRSRARATRSACAVLCSQSEPLMTNIAVYKELDQVISRKCGCGIQDEPTQSEENHADSFTNVIKAYTPFYNDYVCDTDNKSSHDIGEEDNFISDKECCTKDDQICAKDDKSCEYDNGSCKNDDKSCTTDGKSCRIEKKSCTSDEIIINDAGSHAVDKICTSFDASCNINDKIGSSQEKSSTTDKKCLSEKNYIRFGEMKKEKPDEIASVDLSTAISLINRYCGKLPSDTFTRLAPQCWVERVRFPDRDAYICTLRLPLNCPVKYNIVGHPMPTRSLARRMVALQACRILHLSGELDDQLMPIGKENFKAAEMDTNNSTTVCTTTNDSTTNDLNDFARPGTTKRRQYYYKRTAWAFTDCQPVIDTNDTEIDSKVDRVEKIEENKDYNERKGNNSRIDQSREEKSKIDKNRDRKSKIKEIEKDESQKHDIVENKEEVIKFHDSLEPESIGLEHKELCDKEGSNKEIDCQNNTQQITDNHHRKREVSSKQNTPEKDKLNKTTENHKDESHSKEFLKMQENTSKSTEEYKDKTTKKHTNETTENQKIKLLTKESSKSQGTASKSTDINTNENSEEKTNKSTNESSNTDKTARKRNMLYAIVSSLCCALPERYNTRGRRLHAPQHANQAIGVLMARYNSDSLQIPAFPVYTRSGEVRVSIEHVPDADVTLTPQRGRLIRRFMQFVFSEVLRVRRRGMKLQEEGTTRNNYYIVPTIKNTRSDGSSKIDIDWSFLETIYQHTEAQLHCDIDIDKPVLWEQDERYSECGKDTEDTQKEKDKTMRNPLLKDGETFKFDAEKYREAVVTPWYRNQDQPQFFLVAEICTNLTPDSAFPSATHTSFRHYYSSKYGVNLTQANQPLLDVDHTSARLNLLTPRYVNRKGVALPVSSERTRRAKRDRLDQKQILVPELCQVHPFAAPLWFATVALPCVLYRINALLIADEIRRSVAIDVGVGIPKIEDPSFHWPPLDFGWSLAEVLSADSENKDKKPNLQEDGTNIGLRNVEENEDISTEGQKDNVTEGKTGEKTLNDILQEKEATDSSFEIGTWSNDMAATITDPLEYDEFTEPLPPNLTFCTSASGGTNWCDPIKKPVNQFNPSRGYSMADSDCSYLSSDFDTDDSDMSDVSQEDTDDTSGFGSVKDSYAAMGVRIEYKTAHEAEAVDLDRVKVNPAPQPDAADDAEDRSHHRRLLKEGQAPAQYIERFHQSVEKHRKEIIESGCLIQQDEPLKEILPETKVSGVALEIDGRSKKECQEKFLVIEKRSRKEYEQKILEVDEKSKNVEESDKLSESIVDAKALNAKHFKTSEKVIETNRLSNKILQDRLCAKIDSRCIRKDNKITCKERGHEGIDIKQSPTDDQSKKLRFVVNDDALSPQKTDELKHNLKNLPIQSNSIQHEKIKEIFPYGFEEIKFHKNGQIDLESIEKNKRKLLAVLKNTLPDEEIKKLNCFSMVDVNIDSPDYVNEKAVNVGFDTNENYVKRVNTWGKEMVHPPYYEDGKGQKFDFDYQPKLEGHPGPSPSVILQALTMSNANDGINLERLETIGDSFLKFAITAYLYCAHPTVHEGKLSHMRSKQVSNLNLYRLGRNKRLGARMIASKFEPHDNWLPPCHKPPATLHHRQDDTAEFVSKQALPQDTTGCFIPYNLITQHSIPDKSIADCVEALIGAYLLECGPRGALLFMSWLGIKVLPRHDVPLDENHPYVVRERQKVTDSYEQKPPRQKRSRRDSDSQSSDDEDLFEDYLEEDWSWPGRPVGSLRPIQKEGAWVQPVFGCLKAPPSPLLRYISDPEGELEKMLSGYDALEERLQYRFKDRSLLLQAFSHASHQPNRLTDCYQRLEFLGDAILDYLITRHLYLDPRRHSPGALTDLRSALVNNTIFATLAARHGFHKYFRHMSPGLNEVLTKYVKIQEENGHSISEEHYLIQEDELEQAEDVEVPKALGDLFESVAGAIFLDSGMSLQAVWNSYELLMGAELELFSAAAPKSPVRELLEAEPDTAKFGKPERLADGRRVRVCVEVFGRGAFKGVGRNYRIAKGTAARCALRHLKIHRR